MRDAHKLYRFWGRVPPKDFGDLIRAEAPATAEESTAKLYLYGPIDSWGGVWGISAAEVATALNDLGDASTIELHVNSPGGEVFEAIAIMNLLREHPATIDARVDGIAASAGSFIAASADTLVMGQNTELMIHDAWGICIGNAADMADYSEFLGRSSDNIADVYAKKAGGSRDDWREYMKAETWFNAEEAVAAGLADRVAGAEDNDLSTEGGEETAPAARLRFDTAALFEHASRAVAPEPAPVPASPPVPSTNDGVSLDFTHRHRHNARKIGQKL